MNLQQDPRLTARMGSHLTARMLLLFVSFIGMGLLTWFGFWLWI